MAKGNIWVPVAAVLVLTAIAMLYLGITQSLFGLSFASALLFGISIVEILKGLKVKMFQAMPPKADQTALIIGVVIMVILFAMGALTPLVAKFGTGTAASLTTTGAPVNTGSASSLTAIQNCQKSVSANNGNLVGVSATLTLNGYDMEANTPYSGTVGAGVYVFDNGNYVGQYTTAASSVTGVKVGDIVDVYGLSNATYYVDDNLGICVDGAQKPITVTVHSAVTQSGMQVACYASDGTVLSAATTGLGDYNITQGAAQQSQISCILKENTANRAFWLRGIATGATNLSKQVVVLDSQWSNSVVPTFLSTSPVQLNETSGAAMTNNVSNGYQKLFVVASPIKLAQWQQVTTNFRLDAAATDPQWIGSVTPGSVPNDYFMVWLDQGTGRDLTGAVYSDIYTHDTAQSKLGITEDVFSPAGKTIGVLIQTL